MPETRETAAAQMSCGTVQQPEEGFPGEAHGNSHPSSAAGRVENQTSSFEESHTAGETLDEKRARLQRELEELEKEDEKLMEKVTDLERLNKAIRIMEQAIEMDGERIQAAMLNSFGAMLSTRFERTGSMDNLNCAVDAASMVVDAIPQDHPDRAGWLNSLGNWLGTRFERTGSMDDINRAVNIASTAVDATPQDHPDRARYLNNLGNWLGIRFERIGSMNDLNRAVDIASMAVDVIPQDHPNRATILNSLGNWLGTRFERTGAMDDINRAVAIASTVVDITLQNHSDRASWLNNLGNNLGRRYGQTGSIDDLNRAVDVASMAVDATPQDHPDRASYLNNLGNWLGMRFERIGSMDDINHAVDVANTAANATPRDHPDRAGRLNNLGIRLGTRFEQTGSIDDLNRAVDIANTAVDVTPQDHPDRARHLNSLGNWLGIRFEQTGSMDDLNRAIAVASIAVDATPQNHPYRAGRLGSLGNWLGTRFERTGSIDDLNHAIDVANMAVDAIPEDHPNRAGLLNNLGTWLGRRFERTGSIDDINRAVDVSNTAANATPQDYPNRVAILNSLGNWLGARFERTGALDDINRAVDVASTAVDATPKNHPYRLGGLNNLGALFGRRFERTGSMDDLNRAVDIARMVVDTAPQDRPDQAGWLGNLGNWLSKRFEQTGSMDDLNSALSSYKEGWHCYTAPSSIRIHLALEAARILASQQDWEGSSQLLHKAVNLLPTISPRTLKDTDKQHMLSDLAGLASMAAATSLHTGKGAYHALQLLELGRGVIAGLLMDIRGDISDVKRKHPSLADEFISLRDELDSPADRLTSPISGDDTSSWESQAERRREADRKFSELVTKIRAQPGFDSFLQPPAADELMVAAEPGPIIVVNLSPYRCDAFLVERDRIGVLALPKLALGEVEKHAKDLGSDLTSILAWLWRVIVHPCLEALGFTQPHSDGNWPRLWWVPTGALSHFPLHAAGRYVDNSKETILDRVVSSYSSSVKALIHGRRQSVRTPAHKGSGDALLVGMRETPGYSVLNFARSEVEMLEKLCPPLQLNPVKPAQQRHKEVLEHLRSCKIFHFAGHGLSHPSEPSSSCLLLDDWKMDPLTVADLREHWLHENSPFLAYLSACSTGANQAEALADEAIHLINACQLAGFCHVVGTLWDVDDECSLDAARKVYDAIEHQGWNGGAVAQGVHEAAIYLRDKTRGATRNRGLSDAATREEGDPSVWAAYIHVGS